jgi:hypothetical protein
VLVAVTPPTKWIGWRKAADVEETTHRITHRHRRLMNRCGVVTSQFAGLKWRLSLTASFEAVLSVASHELRNMNELCRGLIMPGNRSDTQDRW